MIVWLASYPRSGNTFMRVLLKSCFGLTSHSRYNDVHDIGSDEKLSEIVGHTMYSDSWDEFYQDVVSSNELNIIKTHHEPIDSAKTIYLVRDPRSVAVSFHNYLQNFSPLELDLRDTIVGATAFGSWGKHVNSWQPWKRPDTLIVRFEQLIAEPLIVAEDIAEFLKIERVSDNIPTFSELQNVNSKFFNTGSNEQNIRTLNSDELNLLNFLFKDQMKAMGYESSERVNRAKALDSISEVSKNVWTLQHEVKRQLDENSNRLGLQKQRLTNEHATEMEIVRKEQRVFSDQLKGSIQSSSIQAEALAKQSIALTEKFEDTNEQLQRLWSKNSELNSTVKFLQTKRVELSDELQKARSDHISATEEIATFKIEIAQRDNEIARYAQLRDDLEKARNDHNSAVEENAALQKNLLESENKMTLLQNQESVNEVLSSELDQLRSELLSQENSRSKSSELERIVSDLKTQCSELSKALSRAKSVNKKLDAKVAYRDRTLESSRQSLTATQATLDAREREISNIVSQLQGEKLRVDKFQTFITDMTSQKIEREKFIRELESDVESLHRKAVNLSHRNQELQSKYALAKDQFEEVSEAVAPRIKSILTLKPIRYVVNRRALVKNGNLVLDERGMPIPPNSEIATPPDLQIRSRARTIASAPLSAEGHVDSMYHSHKSKKPLGVAVYTFDRTESVENVLESLLLQDGLDHTHVWIDGDQGNQDRRARLDRTEQCVASFPVNQVHRNRGNYGFRKMMIVSMRKMFEMYERVLFLEDDCFPTRHALKGFAYELDQIEDDPSIFSVYGHPFLTEDEKNGPIGRFQGWGWASTREKLMPLWSKLLETYLMSEDEYKSFVTAEMTEDVLSRIDVTPGRQPSSTLPNFFAWDEALGLLAAQQRLTHKRTSERLIYNFGVGESSTHFNNIDHYRKPPFNMVTIDEIWNYF